LKDSVEYVKKVNEGDPARGRKNRTQATINNAGRESKVEVMTEEGRKTDTARDKVHSYSSSD
jgi:hypothetical protein